MLTPSLFRLVSELNQTQGLSDGFLDFSSHANNIRVHDGRQWAQYKDKYWRQFNWKTNRQYVPPGQEPHITKRQMEHVLGDVLATGGNVASAIRRVVSCRQSTAQG